MKFQFLLLTLFMGIQLNAQIRLSGHVTDSLNNPVPFASVYLSNTTYGTSADEAGAYKLLIPHDGQYILTITSIGYESHSQPVHPEGKDLKINVKLRNRALALNEVTVTAKEGDRKKNLARFSRIFLGESKNARNCKILNPEVLRLHYDSKKNMFSGYSVKPLIIENRALGYKLVYDLKNFEHYPQQRISRYYGTPFFQLMEGTPAEKEIWNRTRLVTYYGSQMHLMRSLFFDNIKAEKFELYELNYNEAAKSNINDKPYFVEDLRLAKKDNYIVFYAMKPIYISYDNPGLGAELASSYSFRYSSILNFKKPIKIYRTGYFEDGYSVAWEGKMGEERVADLLPFDFQPDLFGLSSIEAVSVNETKLTDTTANSERPLEKVYLHLDRERYWSGETIWFKAYLTNAVTNNLSAISNNLHVELISPDANIIDHKIVRLDMGLGNGDFLLKDSLPHGNYQIRAYTRSMQNFNDLFFFHKDIVIGHPVTTVATDNSANLDIQFFPEGGSLIAEVPTVVGFKAISQDGLGCNVRGKIISSEGDSVASFASENCGMGNFSFTTAKQLKYFAEGVSDKGVPFKVPLLESLSDGYAISVADYNDHYFRVSINTNQSTLEEFPFKELVVEVSSRKSLYLTASTVADSTSNLILLPKRELPDGIVCLTLKDNYGAIYSERLFYNHKKSPLQIKVIPDKNTYAPREKVKLKVSVRDSSNNPVTASVSVAVVDGQQVRGYESKSNISTYLLLESEISGNIEQPYSYFDTTNKKRFTALNNLMLTQGWRNYVWRKLSDTIKTLEYTPEKGLTITGRLRKNLVDQPIANANISLAIFDTDKPLFRLTQTDSTGKFCFEAISFTGEKAAVISASGKDNIPQGIISMDSVIYSFPPVNTPRFTATKLEPDKIIQDELAVNYKQTSGNIMLKEVLVKANKPKMRKEDTYFRIYGEPDKSITITPEIASDARSIRDYLKLRVTMPLRATFSEQKPEPLYLVDNVPFEEKYLEQIPFSMVDKIEILKSPAKLAIYGTRGAYGVIIIWLKSGRIKPNYFTPALHSVKSNLKGYYQARTFYSPKYDVPAEDNKPDYRTTLFWEPSVITDSEGNASCTFFNSDNKSTINIAVEGISESGIPVAGKATFEVK